MKLKMLAPWKKRYDKLRQHIKKPRHYFADKGPSSESYSFSSSYVWMWELDHNFGHLMWRTDSLEKTLVLGKIARQEEKGTIEDEMARWHHWVDRHEFEQTLGVGDGQGSQACCSPWGHKELDTTEWQNWTEVKRCIKSDKNIETHLYLNIQRYIVDKIRKILCSSLISKWK